jgi:hypothetical protein
MPALPPLDMDGLLQLSSTNFLSDSQSDGLSHDFSIRTHEWSFVTSPGASMRIGRHASHSQVPAPLTEVVCCTLTNSMTIPAS